MDAVCRLAQRLIVLALVIGSASPILAQPAAVPPAPSDTADGSSVVRAQPGSGKLPRDGGQIWQEYDIRPFVTRVRGLENPEQTIVDWILRETGTEVWFRPPAGVLTAEPEKVRVYHTPEIQAAVAGVIERFVRPDLTSHSVGVRLITLESANWRSLALPYLQPVEVQTPGVEAWLITKEHAAMMRANLKGRVDFREHNSASVRIQHGQSHTIEQRIPRSFPQRISLTPHQYPGYQVQMEEISEGFSLRISPLASPDGRTMEVVIQCSADQIEELTPLPIDLQAAGIAAAGPVEIQVPQIASWRLHERFRWPIDDVLVISRGRVAMPGLKQSNWVSMTALTGVGAPRADALLMLECRTESSAGMAGPADHPTVGRLNYHGRY